MQMIFIAVMVIILPGIAVGEGNIGMLVTIISDFFSHIYFYEGDPSTEADNMTTRSYTFNYKSAKIWSIATDFRRGEIFVRRNVPGDITRLDNVSIWLNNSDVTETVFHRGISHTLSQIAVDWIHGNVYWTDGGFHWIVMQSSRTNDTSTYIVLIQDLQQPFGLAVDPINGYMFWSELGDTPRITRATLSGEESKVLIYSGLKQPSGIALDYTARRVYWVDGHTIHYMDYDGVNRQMFYRFNGAVFISLFSYKDIICVADWKNKRIISFNKDTHKATHAWNDLPGIPTDITMFGELSQPYIEDVCASKMCDHLCVKSQNVSKCLCKNGYHIMDDGTSCEQDSTTWKQEVVFGLDSQICIMGVHGMTSDGAKYSCPIETGGDVSDIEIDMDNGILFYHRDDVIYRHATSNSTEEKLIEITGKIGGMVYDWLNDNLYWTEQDIGRIMMVSIETGVQLPVLENTPSPISITADPHESTLFWISSSSSQSIKSCNMNGGDVKVLALGTVISNPTDLTIDIKAGRIYWLNDEYIKSMKIDGTDIRSEFSTISRPNYIATYKNFVLWTEDSATSSSLKTYAKHNLKAQKAYTFPNKITTLAVFDTELQRNEKGPCWVDNGGCDHICVPMVTSRKCWCELGSMLQPDGETCVSELIDSNYFLLSDYTHQQIYQVSLSNGDIMALDIDNVGSVLGIVYHEDKQKVYWSDQKVGIKSATLGNKTATIILQLYSNGVRQLDIDKETSNIYYTASNKIVNSGYIAMYNEDLSLHQFLIPGLELPQAILLRPSKGVMYWTDTGPGKIFKSNMDGTDIQEIATDLVWPKGLALDNTANKLYYVDGKTNNIGFIDLNGLGRGIFATDENGHLSGIDVAGGYLYYTGFNRFYVTKMNLKKSSDRTKIAQHAEFGILHSIYVVSDEKEPRDIVCATRNGQCSQLCLPTKDGRTCACGDGVDLNPDGRSCVTDTLCNEVIQNGALSPSCLRYEGEVCTFSCSNGYELAVSSSSSLRCETGGKWNVPTDGLCQAKKPQPETQSSEMIIGISLGTGSFIILIIVGIIIACVIHRNRKPQPSNDKPYETLSISDVGATRSNYVSNLNRD